MTRALALLLVVLAVVPAAAPCQKGGGPFRDPEDGRMDVSEWLLTKKGLLPIPILVTEPAVGYGGGLVLAYFSQSLAEGADTSGQRPTTSVVRLVDVSGERDSRVQCDTYSARRRTKVDGIDSMRTQ